MDGADDLNPPDTPLERPDDPYYYQNYWPRHAQSFFRMQRNKIRALDIIPPGPDQSSYIDSGDKRMQAAWDRDRDSVWAEAEEYERLGRPHALRFV
ncbi:hypothetical protein PVAG01_07016 [Phlyctema vagabunda]|uniref:Uncharacterized protein n=1 Tax=Phlyctema vagabunda TaxID=108571 RepID=A0ABR4PB71_9HELO